MKTYYVVTIYDNEADVEVSPYIFDNYNLAKDFLISQYNKYIKDALLYDESELNRDQCFEPCLSENSIECYSVITYSNGSKIEFFFGKCTNINSTEVTNG